MLRYGPREHPYLLSPSVGTETLYVPITEIDTDVYAMDLELR